MNTTISLQDLSQILSAVLDGNVVHVMRNTTGDGITHWVTGACATCKHYHSEHGMCYWNDWEVDAGNNCGEWERVNEAG